MVVAAPGQGAPVELGTVTRALSVWQPWASLIALGLKRVETRPWSTSHRGPLAIHAAGVHPRQALADFGASWAHTHEIAEALMRAGVQCWDALPRGAVIAVAELEDVLPTGEFLFSGAGRSLLLPSERAFGDYGPGRYGWVLGRVAPIGPVPMPGRQGLWPLPAPLPSGSAS